MVETSLRVSENKINILVVDDDPDIVSILKSIVS